MKRYVMAIVMVAALALAGAAYAQAPQGNGYGGGNNNGVLDDVDRIPPPSDSNPGGETDENIPGETVDREVGAPNPSAGDTGTSLPFTGLDVGLLALGGLAMLGVGVGIRRLSATS